jgi:hypothetical protein
MAGFNPAWFIAFGLGMLGLTEVLFPARLRPTVRYVSFPVSALCVLIGIIGFAIDIHDYYSHPAVPEALLATQLQELKDLQNFIGNKDENELQDLFAFRDTLYFNIELAKQRMEPSQVPASESQAIDRYFAGGNARIDLRYVAVGRDAAGTVVVNMIPGKIGIINTSKQFALNRAKLFTFESSLDLPSEIRNSVRDFDKTLDDNMALMLVVMNEQFAGDPNSIIEDETKNSPLWGVIENAYFKKFIALRPKADNVVDAIRRYLKVS